MEFKVTELAMRPASDKCQCFYCQQPIGENHKPDCVTIRRTVRMRMTVEFERPEPVSADKDLIEFGLNESSWCQGNILEELKRYWDERNMCGCGECEFEVIEMRDDVHLGEK